MAFAVVRVVWTIAVLMPLMSLSAAPGCIASYILADLWAPEEEVVVLAGIRFPLFPKKPLGQYDRLTERER